MITCTLMIQGIRIEQSEVSQQACSDAIFSDFLLRNGEELIIKIPNEMLIKYDDDENIEDSFINNIFLSFKENAHLVEYITQRAIFATRNNNVSMVNEKLIEMYLEHIKVLTLELTILNYYQEEF